MLEHLKPISKQHSISKAIATIFIAQPILKPEVVVEKLITNGKFQLYQKKSISHQTTLQFNVKQNVVSENKKGSANGFLFESYNESGKIKNIFRLQNGESNLPTVLSFETRAYNRWDDFFKTLKQDFLTFSNVYSCYISAISLTYIDDFNWESEENILVKNIFNNNSEFLNEKFLASKDGMITLLTQGEDSEEKAEITFSNRVKKIIINHQYAKTLTNLELFQDYINSENFDRHFEEAHNSNKEILKDLLTREVQDLIKLT